MSDYQKFLDTNKQKLLGHFLLKTVSNGSNTLEAPYPPSILNEEHLNELKGQLRECMPLDSMITDLWDWDLHFEKDLDYDWYFDTIFGDESRIDQSAESLSEYFLEKCDKYGIYYHQDDDDLEFEAMVLRQAKLFIIDWRNRAFVKYSQNNITEDVFTKQ